MFRVTANKVTLLSGIAYGASSQHLKKQPCAHMRPHSLSKARVQTDEKHSPALSVEAKLDDWLDVNIRGDDIVFTSEEINKTVENFVNCRTGCISHVKIEEICENSENLSDGSAADAVIDDTKNTVMPNNLKKIQFVEMAERLLSKGNVQRSLISAIGEDSELKKMLIDFGTIGLIQNVEHNEEEAQDLYQITDAEESRPNPIEKVLKDIAKGMKNIGIEMLSMGQRIGSLFKRIGQWLINNNNIDELDVEETDNESHFIGRTAGFVMSFSVMIILFLIAKRVFL